ncbi:hypothetical protein AX17_001777 [Amanita inopinata Kibby_2008]|nr:hypothetical protein AX17_001777 [Amanita inopinata Kibby_2008]
MSAQLVLRSTLPRVLSHRAFGASTVLIRHSATDASGTVVPGGPIYKGTVNDPTPFPTPSRVHGSYHWAFERLLAAGLVPTTIAAFAASGTQHPILDGLLGVSLVVHSHIGFDCILVDYMHKRKFPILGPTMTWTLRTATVATLVGIYQFNTNDIGLTEFIAKIWTA